MAPLRPGARASAEAYLAVCAAVPRLDFFAAQRDIPAPTLVLAGAADPNLPGLAPDALVRDVPDARLHSFREAGHFPNLECPEEFNDRVIAFLR